MKKLISSTPNLSILKPVVILASVSFLTACNDTRSSEIDEPVKLSADTAAVEKSLAKNTDMEDAASFDDMEFEQFEELYLATDSTASIWPRIREGFQLPDDVNHKSLQNEINWVARHPEYIQRVMKRADPFLYYILEETEKRGLPTELVLLPIVESAYQPFAYSHGRAAGIWQFIPSTGKLYGLKKE